MLLHNSSNKPPSEPQLTALHHLGSITPPPSWCNTPLCGVTPARNKQQCGHAPQHASRYVRQAAQRRLKRRREIETHAPSTTTRHALSTPAPTTASTTGTRANKRHGSTRDSSPTISHVIPPGTNPHTAGNLWNSNDPNSMFEIVIRELRATFWGSMRGMDSVCDSSAMDSAIASVTTRQTIQRRTKRRLATEKHAPATRPLTAAPISRVGTVTPKPLELASLSVACAGTTAPSADS